MLKTGDQQSANVVCGVIDWAHDFGAATIAQPLLGHVEKRSRNINVINRFKQAKATDVGFMEQVVVWIVARHDSANDVAISLGQEQGGIAVLVKRVPGSVEKGAALDDERRYPDRIVFVNPPLKVDERIAFRSR